jgi:hypothetical protein
VSERFGIADHAPQHAPDHALKNPTPQGSWGGVPDWPAPTGAGVPAGYGGGAVASGPMIQLRKSVALALVLATVLGPLGLFYVSFLNGVAALVILPPVVRGLARAVSSSVGGNMDTVRFVAIPILWCFTIPWSIFGVRWRNRKIDGLNASIVKQ